MSLVIEQIPARLTDNLPAIPLSASPDDIRDAVRRMYTDPDHLKVSDPGKVEGNVVFTYLDAFSDDAATVSDLKTRYRRGGLGDIQVKKHLEEVLQTLLWPIRDRRARLAKDPGEVMRILREGTDRAREVTQETLDEVRAALGLFRWT